MSMSLYHVDVFVGRQDGEDSDYIQPSLPHKSSWLQDVTLSLSLWRWKR